MPIIRTLKETGHSYEAAKQRLLQATAHLQDDEESPAPRLKVHRAPKRNRIISDSSSSSSSSSSSNGKRDDDDDGDDDGDDDEEEEEEMIISQKRQKSKEKKLLRNLEKEMKRKRTIVSISRPSSYQRTDSHAITPAKPKTRKPKSAMSMISALNESSEEPDSDEESEVELTKEAQEEEGFSLYRKALEFQRSGNVEKARETYNELLQTRFLSKVKASQEERRGGVTNTAITLKYSTYKNLGNLATAREDTDNAMENYLEAVNLDSTDVTLWYKIGTVAIKLSQLALARVAFEQGLRCSKFHWPCLDYLCTVLYAINDYVTCLYYVSQALERDKRYTKGFALREQIFSEQPCLRRDCLDLFKHCDEDIFYHEVPKDKRQKVIDEALLLRYTRQKLSKAPPLPRIKFLQPLNELRWKLLGERLIALYDHMTSRDPPMSLITILDLEDYKSKQPAVKEVSSEVAKMGPSPTPMDVDPSNQTEATASPVPSRREVEPEDRQIPPDTPEQLDGQTPGQMGGQTRGQMGEQTPGQMGEQTPGQMGEQTPGQMGEQTPGQMGEQTPGQMGEQTSGQMGEQTPGQMGEQTPGQMAEQTPGQMGEQTPGQIGEQTPGQMGGQTPGQMGGQTPGQMGGQTPGQMAEQTPGQMLEQTRATGQPKQTDVEVAMDVDPVTDEEAKPVESKTATIGEEAGTLEQNLGSSARTLKQLAEAYLKSLEGHEVGPLLPEDAASAAAVHMVKEQDPPDSTTAGLDSTPAPCDLPNIELQADSAAGSSQDSIQQSGRESNMGESSSQDKDAVARQQNKCDIQHEDVVSMDTEESQSEKSRRGPKKKRMLRDLPAPGKRRSARVRNTTVKQKKEEEEIVNYTEVLRQFLPSTLLVSDDEEEEEQLTKTGEKESKKPDVQKAIESPVNERDVFTAMETDDVHSLLVECQLNNGIVDVMSRYLERLVAKHDLKWPDGLAAVFLDVYKRLRKHISLPELLCCDEDERVVREMSMMCLLSAEINLDQCLSAKTNGNTPAASPAMLGANTTTCTHKWGEHLEDDMMYLQELTLMQYMLPDLWPVIPARVYWLKARYYLQVGKTSEGEEAFQRCKEVLTREEERRMEDRKRAKDGTVGEEEMETDDTDRPRPAEVVVANIKHGALISLVSVSSEVESLQRCQSLEQLQRLHASGKHGKVVELLRPTVRHAPRPVRPENTPERCSQLVLLIQSQMELKDTKESILCCVLGMVETWQGVQRDGMQVYHQLWLETLNKLLVHLQKAFQLCEISSLGVGGTGLLRKAVNVLIKIIEWTMDQGDVTETTNATSIMPWVVLYHVIKYEEDHLAAKSLPSSDHDEERSRSPSSVPMLPSSLMLLENAHEYLGRQSWCCNCEGVLLKLYIRVLSTELGKYSEDERHPFFGDLRHTLEQCFFCLYGHPTKKTKTRHLQDHGALEVPLDWSNCCYIFDYFKPKTFPEFDSYKTSSMSSELEGLLLKLSKVIPQNARPENALELVQGYVDGTNDKAPSLPEGFDVSSTVVQELYYLLADYYFKNKDFGKAIKFYVHDICVSPNRLDSWAGMALARVGRLDLKLNNSTDTKSDGPIFKHGVAALRCFKRALEIDATNYSLWIESGSYAYILHSHASRQIKQKDQLKISDEDVIPLSLKQAEMLEQAEHCFKQASMCEGEGDEEWLVHYMLGKVAEKRLLMEESLRHYLKASHHLHESEARYPKKIPYHNPTDFSLEALEMYFRIHSAILKLVQCSLPGTKVKLGAYGTLEGLVQEAAQLPFVRAEEKKREPSSDPSTDTEQEARMRPSKPDTPPSLAPKRRGSPVYVATPQDHDYLHEKYRRSRSRVSSQEEPTTDTASESDIFSGDESMSSFLSAQRTTISLRPVPARRALSAAEAQAIQPTLDGAPSISGTGDEARRALSAAEAQAIQPTLDGASSISGTGDEAILRDEEGMSQETSTDAECPDKGQPEDRTSTEGNVAPESCPDTKKEIPAIVISKPSPESEAAVEMADASMTSAEDKNEVTEKPDQLSSEMDPTSVADPPSDAKPAVAMDTEEVHEPEHVFVAPAPASSRGEEKNQDDEGYTDVKALVAMDTDEAGATRKSDADEAVGFRETDGEGLGEIKEDLGGNLEGNTSEEKIEKGSSGDTGVQEEEDEGKNKENQLCEAQKMEITKEEEKREVEEGDKAGEIMLLQKEDNPHDDELKKNEDIKEEVGINKEEDAQGGMKAKVRTPDLEDEDKEKRKEDVEREPVTLISNVNKEAKTSDHGSDEALPSDLQTQASISQVGEVAQGRETDDLSVMPGIEKEAQPRMETKTEEAQSANDDATKDKSKVHALPPGDGILSRGNEEKQEQVQEMDDCRMDEKSPSIHTASGGDLLKEDGGSAEDGPHPGDGPGDKPEKSDAEKTTDQESAQGDEKDKKVDVEEERRVEDGSKVDVQEKMDTNIQEKDDADQNKEDNSSRTLNEIEGSKTDIKKKEDDEADDQSLAKKKASEETEPLMEGETEEGKTERQKAEGETVEVDEQTEKRHLSLIDACVGAMRLCLQRFPQHYKAAYRMAYLYAYAPTHKNLTWSKDILIGGASGYPPKTPADHIVAPGLFSEQHKSKNLFQGIWRNPIQDIDRSGSFPWHMYRSVALLVHILRELKDHILLLQVTTKLYRIPEQGKKYLRDADRHFLAREAFNSYRGTIRVQLASPSITGEERLGLTLSSYRCFQYTQVKQPTLSALASELLISAFTAFKGNAIEAEPALLDQAARFCDHHIAFHKLPRTPTQGEAALPRGFHKDSPSSSSSRLGLSSESRRPVGRSFSSGSDQGGEPMDHDGKAAGRGEAMDATEGGLRDPKTSAEGSVRMTLAKTPADSRIQEHLRAGEKGNKDGGHSQREQSSGTSEQEGSRRAERTVSGMPEGGMKRKFSEVETTSENIASIVQQAARQYEKTEAQRKERLGKNAPSVPQAKRFAGGITEPSSSEAFIASIVQQAASQYVKTEAQRKERLGKNSPSVPQAKRFAGGITEPSSSEAFLKSQPRVHIGALGSVITMPRDMPQQRPISLVRTSKQTVSSSSSGNASKMVIMKKRVGPPPHAVSRDPSPRSEATATKPSTIKSPLSPTSAGSFADSFQKFLMTQQKQVSSLVKTYNIPSPESTTRQNPISMVTSGSLLGQVGMASKVKQASSASTSAAAVGPRPLGTSDHATTSHSSSQQFLLKPRVGISQVAKITSSSTSVQGVRHGSEVIGHREPLAARREHSSLDQGHPTRESEGNVGGPGVSQEASRTVVKAGSSQGSKEPPVTGKDLLTNIDSTKESRT